MPEKIQDSGTERALIGCILKNGKDAFIEADTIVQSGDFYFAINRTLYQCMKSLVEDNDCEEFNNETIRIKAKNLGVFGCYKRS